jgi:hypothetical protein
MSERTYSRESEIDAHKSKRPFARLRHRHLMAAPRGRTESGLVEARGVDEEVEDPTAKRLLTTTVAVVPRLLH